MKKLLVVCMLLLMVGCSSEKKINVGVIQFMQHEALDSATQGFVDVLTAEYGDAVVVDVKNASGDSSVCATIATNFVADGYDLIMANATPALQAAAHATNSIPVLGTSVTEYGVALDIDNFNGLVGTNVSGTSDLAPLDEQAQMILDLVKDVKNVGLLYCSAEANSIYQVKVVKEYLESKGIITELYSFSDSNDVASVAAQACSEVDALYIPTDNTCASYGTVIANAANESKTPIITGEKDTLKVCEGLATLSIDYYELGKTTGQMAVKILNGEAKVSEMPIEYYENPTKMYIEDSCRKLGIDIPEGYTKIED